VKQALVQTAAKTGAGFSVRSLADFGAKQSITADSDLALASPHPVKTVGDFKESAATAVIVQDTVQQFAWADVAICVNGGLIAMGLAAPWISAAQIVATKLPAHARDRRRWCTEGRAADCRDHLAELLSAKPAASFIADQQGMKLMPLSVLRVRR
jgi:hypothetical protein